MTSKMDFIFGTWKGASYLCLPAQMFRAPFLKTLDAKQWMVPFWTDFCLQTGCYIAFLGLIEDSVSTFVVKICTSV